LSHGCGCSVRPRRPLSNTVRV